MARKTITLQVLLLTTVAFPAFAQEASTAGSGEILLDEIVVSNTEDAAGPVQNETDPLTATGGKVPLNTSEIPQSVSVLGRSEIEAFGASQVSESIRYTAGVTAEVFGDDKDYDWLRVRGFQADQTGIYLDNAQNLAFAFGSFYIDPYTLERIEVLRGPSSALYGGSNPGGILNYVSKRAGEDVGEVTIGAEASGAGWLAFDYGKKLDADNAYRITGRTELGDKYDDLNTGWRGTLAGSYKTTTSDGTELTVITNIHKADEKHNGSTFLPYYGTVSPTSEFGYIDKDANFSDSDWDSYEREQGTVSLIAEHEFDNRFTLTGIGRIGYAKVDERYYYPYGYSGYALKPTDQDATLSMIAFEHETEVFTAQADTRYYGLIDTGPLEHNLLFGLDARKYWLDEVQASGYGVNSVVNPTNPGIPVTSVYQDAETTQSQIGLYFQDQIRFGSGWIATGNLRYDGVSTEQDGATGFSRTDGEISYRVALAHQFDNGFTPYISHSTFFNPLIVSPADGVTEPESGSQTEVGVKWASPDERFGLSAALFQIDQENVVTGAWPNYNQLGEVRMRGFEIEGQYDFANGLIVKGAATLLDPEITKDSDSSLLGKAPTLVPDTELNLYAQYSFEGTPEKGLTLGAGVRYRGESYADAANTLTVSDATLFDASASYVFDNGLKADLDVTNIADKRYVTGCQTAYVCSYGSGREISVSLTKLF